MEKKDLSVGLGPRVFDPEAFVAPDAMANASLTTHFVVTGDQGAGG